MGERTSGDRRTTWKIFHWIITSFWRTDALRYYSLDHHIVSGDRHHIVSGDRHHIVSGDRRIPVPPRASSSQATHPRSSPCVLVTGVRSSPRLPPRGPPTRLNCRSRGVPRTTPAIITGDASTFFFARVSSPRYCRGPATFVPYCPASLAASFPLIQAGIPRPRRCRERTLFPRRSGGGRRNESEHCFLVGLEVGTGLVGPGLCSYCTAVWQPQ